MQAQRVAIVGGGMAGLTAAFRLSKQGYAIDLYEAAPALGGRTKSFYDQNIQAWVDNGPHMMVGAYHATKQLLEDVDAGQLVSWQDSLTLPLWDKPRGFFALKATSKLPIALALLWAVAKLPQHDFSSVKAMLRIALSMKNIQDETLTVRQWLEQCQAPALLIQDMLEVLCLGVMNEPINTANAKTFARVLNTSFSAHKNAKMGWFNQPLSQALITPIQDKLEQAGVNIHLRHSIRDVSSLNHDAIILALPAFARHRLLGSKQTVACQAITNVHLWFEQPLPMPSMMLGMLGTYSQWLFDVSTMLSEQGSLQHLCITISADSANLSQEACVQKVMQELESMFDKKLTPPQYSRVICEKRATVLVREQQPSSLPAHIFDAGEMPNPGQLPATIELAVLQGEKAARSAIKLLK
ncbi:MAG: FAD-dependent oxidoreductase [Mariprofundaceae bacterium]|nr:FAD-dependent oxidoreductase [Mariprofundaceae bacterium]